MTIYVDPIKFEIHVTIAQSELSRYNVYAIVDEILCAIERNEYVRKLIDKKMNNNE